MKMEKCVVAVGDFKGGIVGSVVERFDVGAAGPSKLAFLLKGGWAIGMPGVASAAGRYGQSPEPKESTTDVVLAPNICQRQARCDKVDITVGRKTQKKGPKLRSCNSRSELRL